MLSIISCDFHGKTHDEFRLFVPNNQISSDFRAIRRIVLQLKGLCYKTTNKRVSVCYFYLFPGRFSSSFRWLISTPDSPTGPYYGFTEFSSIRFIHFTFSPVPIIVLSLVPMTLLTIRHVVCHGFTRVQVIFNAL